jgi:hypothetical protein
MGTMSEVSSMEEYLKYKEEFIKTATETYKMTKEQALAYLNNAEALKGLNT